MFYNQLCCYCPLQVPCQLAVVGVIKTDQPDQVQVKSSEIGLASLTFEPPWNKGATPALIYR
jgi:hypothetical protein